MEKVSEGFLVSGSKDLEEHEISHNSWLSLLKNAPKLWEQSEWVLSGSC